MAAQKNKSRLPSIPWFYATRSLGVLFMLYGLLVDHSPDRATIILIGGGLVGYDRVKRSDAPKSAHNEE